MAKLPKVIIFVGPQGSGKGTQAKILNDKIHGEYIGMGILLRAAAEQSGVFGQHIKTIIEHGGLVSEKDLKTVLEEHLKSLDLKKTLIFDGVPRTISQAEYLLPRLNLKNKSEAVTLHISLPRAESIKRLQLRRVCEHCATGTELSENLDPRACASCGGKLVLRADDTPELINRRLDLYEQETIPVLRYLKTCSDFYEIDGTPPIPQVSAIIAKAIMHND